MAETPAHLFLSWRRWACRRSDWELPLRLAGSSACAVQGVVAPDRCQFSVSCLSAWSALCGTCAPKASTHASRCMAVQLAVGQWASGASWVLMPSPPAALLQGGQHLAPALLPGGSLPACADPAVLCQGRMLELSCCCPDMLQPGSCGHGARPLQPGALDRQHMRCAHSNPCSEGHLQPALLSWVSFELDRGGCCQLAARPAVPAPRYARTDGDCLVHSRPLDGLLHVVLSRWIHLHGDLYNQHPACPDRMAAAAAGSYSSCGVP